MQSNTQRRTGADYRYISFSDQYTGHPSPGLHYDYLIKVLLLGDNSVGKSSILSRYVEDSFSSDIMSTIGVDFKVSQVIAKNGKVAKIMVWDTAGQERFRSIIACYYKASHCVVMVYDVTSTVSLHNCMHVWLKEVERLTTSNPVMILVGNKCDLRDLDVTLEAAEAFAQKHDMIHIRISAKSGLNVSKIFENLTVAVMELREGCDASMPLLPFGVGGGKVTTQVMKKARPLCCGT